MCGVRGEAHGGQAGGGEGQSTAESGPLDQGTHTLGQFHSKAHQSPPRTLHEGEEHVVTHEDLLTWDEQRSVDIGTKLHRRGAATEAENE